MDTLSSLSVLLGSSWTSGINLYLTVGLLGIAERLNWIELPGSLDAISHPLVIGVAILLYGIEFIADKIPLVDSAWDSVHTFIRPVGGAALGYLASSSLGPQFQVPIALLTGSVSLESHLTKASARAAINTSPEPITNSIASVTEDATVVGVFYLMMKHPVVASIVAVFLILLSFWILKKLFRFVQRIFSTSKDRDNRSST